MQVPQSLQTIAEISIAFAGFSGLIVALRRNTGPLTEVEKYRLKVLLALAFGAMFLSFLPELLQDLEFGVQKIWLYASSALSLYSVVFLIWWISASLRIMRDVPEIFNWFAFSRMAAGHMAIVSLQIPVICSVLVEKGAAVYMIGLIWYLMHAAQQFARMLFVQPRISER
ncbi:MAG: hypothetical protein OER97_08535 [Gammaproteobacteria bacterium]|nr:hypothetical protein [Gammaproteobacteria bacterium]